MLDRLVVIVMLVLHAAGVPGVIFTASTTGPTCLSDACCTAVERTTCCGETTTEMVCSRSGGDCQCVVDPGHIPEPTPPMVRSTDTASVFVPAPQPILTIGSERIGPTGRLYTSPRPERTHNLQQALLGIWRT